MHVLLTIRKLIFAEQSLIDLFRVFPPILQCNGFPLGTLSCDLFSGFWPAVLRRSFSSPMIQFLNGNKPPHCSMQAQMRSATRRIFRENNRRRTQMLCRDTERSPSQALQKSPDRWFLRNRRSPQAPQMRGTYHATCLCSKHPLDCTPPTRQ